VSSATEPLGPARGRRPRAAAQNGRQSDAGELVEPLDTGALVELAPADDEDGEQSGNGTVRGLPPLAAPRVSAIPPREHTERERLAMRPEIRGDLGPLIDDLHTLFERHLAVAKQASAARCGICYLHYSTADLEYREADGFYVCAGCSEALRGKPLPMIRRQPR
jgi:hypothetical protein